MALCCDFPALRRTDVESFMATRAHPTALQCPDMESQRQEKLQQDPHKEQIRHQR